MPPDWPASSQARWIKPLLRIALFLTCHYRVIGKENLPDPPYVLVSNHRSYWDIPAMNHPLPFGTVGLAARKYKGTWKELIFELYPAIWITQFSADRQALRGAITVLKYGGVLGIAPEGTRSKTGGLIQGHSGATFVASRARAPIVPAALVGTDRILKRPRPTVTVRIGRPFYLPEERVTGKELDHQTERIMCAIAALLPEQYHGIYAGNPLIEEMRAIVS
jgi:1-acyl-sn-glycerol-3-phosphate acyltransferase